MNQTSRHEARAAHSGPPFLVWEGRLTEVREAAGYARLRVSLDPSFPTPLPGQFLMVRFAWGPALPRALSPLSAGPGWVGFLVKVDGVLREAMARAPRGTALEIRGPYGTPYLERLDRAKRYVVAGGGSGVAPLLHLTERHPELVAASALGFRKGDVRALLPGIDLVAEDEGGETADGRLRAVWSHGLGVIACGPEPLLASVAREFGDQPATFVSLETRLGCGFGACLGCSIETPAGMRRVCVDGPLFACSEVPWLG